MEYPLVAISTPQFQAWIGNLGFLFLINIFFLLFLCLTSWLLLKIGLYESNTHI